MNAKYTAMRMCELFAQYPDKEGRGGKNNAPPPKQGRKQQEGDHRPELIRNHSQLPEEQSGTISQFLYDRTKEGLSPAQPLPGDHGKS